VNQTKILINPPAGRFLTVSGFPVESLMVTPTNGVKAPGANYEVNYGA